MGNGSSEEINNYEEGEEGEEEYDDDSSDMEIQFFQHLQAQAAAAIPSPPSTNEWVLQDHLREAIYKDTGCSLTTPNKSIFNMIQNREMGGSLGHMSRGHIGQNFIPKPLGVVLKRYQARVFCSKFSQDGSILMSATQDQMIYLYDTLTWKKKREIQARDTGWAVLDIDYSPDQRWCIYSGWSDEIYLCNIVGEHEVHDSLRVNTNPHHFCLFSVKFSPDNNTILGGSNDGCIYMYDLNRRELTGKVLAHDGDINTVSYVEDNDINTIISGSDDCLCKVWDRRTMRNDEKPAGIFVGHSEGITHVASKQDGKYFISNGKDQKIKLWDLRKMTNSEETRKFSHSSADYRFFNGARRRNSPAVDNSLLTFQSHKISSTLIRCFFSPAYTGQKYIYTGSADGSVYIYDILTGKVATKLEGHRAIIRDLSWHPFEPLMVTSSWDGTLAKFTLPRGKLEK